jgi:hypothetical protein
MEIHCGSCGTLTWVDRSTNERVCDGCRTRTKLKLTAKAKWSAKHLASRSVEWCSECSTRPATQNGTLCDVCGES